MQVTNRFSGWRLLSWLLCLIFLTVSFAGCGRQTPEGSTSAGGTAKGRFLEEELTLPENITMIEAMGRLADGSLEMMALTGDGMERKLFSSKNNGGSWEEMSLPKEIAAANCPFIYAAAISADGQIYISGGFGTDGASMENWLFDSDGQGRKLDIPLEDTEPSGDDTVGNFISEGDFTDDGSLFVVDVQQNIYQINGKTGEVSGTVGTSDDATVFDGAGNSLFYFSEGEVHILRTDAGKSGTDSVLPDAIIEENTDSSYVQGDKTMVFDSEGDDIFYASHQGIYHYNTGGSVSEQMVNGELNSLGNPNVSFRKLFHINEDTFLLWAKDESDKDVLLKYAYSADASTVPDKELTVYALEDSSEIRQAISAFQKEHDDIYVNLKIGRSGDDAVTADDALRTLNSDIMAGEGPDVIILDGMPVDNYIDKGLLMDISDVAEEVKSENSLFENLCGVYEKDGKYYGLPSRFLLPFVEGEKQAVDAAGTIDGLASYIQSLSQNGSEHPVICLSASTLLGYLFDADSARWIDGTKVDQEGLQKFFESAKSIYDADDDKENALDLETQGIDHVGSSGTLNLFTGDIAVNLGTIGSDADLMAILSVNQQVKDKTLTYGLLNGQEKKIFIPYLSAGISSKSNHPDEARAFIKTMLSEEVGSVSGNGLPVNRTAFDALMQQEEGTSSSMAFTNEDGEMISLDMTAPTGDDIKTLSGIIDTLDTAAVTDTVLREQIVEQGEAYLNGSQSLADTVQSTMQKIELYLSE